MKRLLFALGFCLPVFAAPAILRNAPAIASDDGVFAIRTGDFNGDGHLDFAVQGLWQLHFHLGNGDGGFEVPIDLNLVAGQDLEFADLDGDGDLDFVTNRPAPSGGAQFESYLNDGSAHFTVANVATIWSIWKFVLADVNGDSKADLIGCGAQYQSGNGNGTFGAPAAFSLCSSSNVDFVFDADSDGDYDILVASPADQSRLYRNNGTGGFTPIDVPVQSSRVAIGDFDGNTLPDIAWLNANGQRLVAFASAGGAYTAQASDSGYANVLDLTAADLNADGRPDLIAGGYGLTHVWLTEPGGTLGAHTIYANGNETAAVATGDFDEDGSIDVLAAGRAGTISGVTAHSLVSLLRGSAGGALDAMRAHQVPRTSSGSALVSSSIRKVALSDINGDEYLDMAVDTKEGRLATFAGVGNGTFASPVITPVGSSWESPFASYERSVFADFNGDGRKDAARLIGSGSIDVWLAQPGGAFIQGTSMVTGLAEPAAGDFNGDGKTDLLAFDSHVLMFFRGLGNGTFAGPVATMLSPNVDTTFPPVIGDFNHDGRDDVAAGSFAFLAQANGVFVRVATTAPSDPTLAADLNADGNDDLVFALKDAPQGTILTYLSNGNGTFGSPRRIFVLSHAFIGPAAAAADIDGDGNTDVILGATVLLGDGTGGFDGYARFRTLGAMNALAIGDIDKNGSLDLVSGTTETLNVVLTKTVDGDDLPLTVTVEELDAPVDVGSIRTAEAEVLGERFAAAGAVMFAIDGVVGAFAEPLAGDAASSLLIAPAGNVALTATYGGDAIYAAAASTPAPMTIAKTTAVASAAFSPAAPTWQDAVHVTGQLQGLTYLQPRGTIAVMLDGSLHSTIAAPIFDINLGMLSQGTHSVVLQYGGDANFEAQDVFVSFSVGKPTAPFQFSMTPVGPHVLGSTTTVKVYFPNHPAITGVVRFYRDNTILGQATISNARASLDVLMTPPIGDARFGATFLGNDLYAQTEVQPWLTGISDTLFAPGPSGLHLLTPCRVIDTRNPAGDYGGPTLSFVRKFLMAGRCGIPFGARAVALNVTAVNPPAAGYFILFAAPQEYPGNTGTSTISYRANKTRANNAIVSLSAGGYMGIYNGHYELPVHVLVDVTGYFK